MAIPGRRVNLERKAERGCQEAQEKVVKWDPWDRVGPLGREDILAHLALQETLGIQACRGRR